MNARTMPTDTDSTALPRDLEPTTFVLPTADGFPTIATRFEAQGLRRGQLIVAGATGVPQRFYRAFARYASERGYETLTLDYRGVGLSKPRSLRGFRMDYLDWARLDLAAAVQAMPTAGGPLFMVGHSFGGHAFGVLPGHERVERFHGFGVGAGWAGWMKPTERLRVRLMWHVIGPVIVRWKGYLAWSMLGFGEDLPLGVYRDWKRWCGYPRYFFDDPDMRDVTAGFARVRTPMVTVTALDDAWAPPASRDAFMRGYSQAPWSAVEIDPAASGLGPLGHMGYFRPHASALWRTALDWLEGR